MEDISNESAETLLEELVAIPSPSGQEERAARHLADWMCAQGYEEAGVDAVGNAVGRRGGGERVLLLLGHIDTFRGQPPVRRDERRLYGRGAVDAKGALCAFAVAGAAVPIPAGWRLVVVGAVEEESASSRGARHIAQQWQPAACLIGEPSGWERITVGYKGRLVLDWRWHGPLGHSAGRQVRGLEEALSYWGKIQEWADRQAADEALSKPLPKQPLSKRTQFERLDATLQALRNEDDGLYETVKMTIGLRLPPRMDPKALARECQSFLGAGATLQPSAGEWAVEGERDSTLSRALRGSIRAEGGQPRFVRKTGTADWNVVARHWSCPILAYGPGDAALDHTPQEHIDLAEYLRAIAVLRGALPRVMAN